MDQEQGGESAERVRDALKAAHLYYVQELTMEAIASELQTSRSSVSRLLAYARSSGLVVIQIRAPHDGANELGSRIRDRFGIRTHIVPTTDRISDIDRLERVALSAARILDRFFDSNMTIGLAWGSTINAVSRHLVPKVLHNSQFVQLNGAGNVFTTGVDYASEILRRFGDAYSSTIQEFPVPAFFDDPIAKELFWKERGTTRILGLQGSLDAALFGLGSPFADVPSHVYTNGYLDEADFASLTASGVVGDVASVFFRADGSNDGVALNARASGPAFAVLQRIPRRICVVAGHAKLPSLRGALAAGLVTDLVIDESTARGLADS
jgi:DNA-binding transcriptional regulator LsrR (DeoR family)